MPLKLNVGLGRKVGDANYGSHGANINLETEVDSSLVLEPEKLKERLRQLFGLVRNSLNEELHVAPVAASNGCTAPLNGNGHHANPSAPTNFNGAQNGSENTNGHSASSNGKSVRPATQSQVNAIFAIARNQRVDLETYLRERFGVGRPVDLNIQDASAVIDQLKSNENSGG